MAIGRSEGAYDRSEDKGADTIVSPCGKHFLMPDHFSLSWACKFIGNWAPMEQSSRHIGMP